MSDDNVYYRCYYRLFNAVTDQIKALEALDNPPPDIISALKAAQCETENMYITDGE